MNIFVLDENPRKAAEYHNDKHVVKMILETCQILTTVYYTNQGITSQKEGKAFRDKLTEMFPTFPRDNFYALSHLNHPSCKWVQNSQEAWRWTLRLGQYLCEEYTCRYNRTHACQEVLNWFDANPPLFFNEQTNQWSKRNMGIPPNATSLKEYKSFNSWQHAVTIYRQYYKQDKHHIANWKTQKPTWYN